MSCVFNPEKISMLHARMLHMRVESPAGFDATGILGYHLDHSHEMAFSLKSRRVKVDFRATVETDSGCSAGEARGFFHLEFLYGVEELEEFIASGRAGKPVLGTSLGGLLGSVTYSTSRGILLERLRGTALEGFILPVIHPDKRRPL